MAKSLQLERNSFPNKWSRKVEDEVTNHRPPQRSHESCTFHEPPNDSRPFQKGLHSLGPSSAQSMLPSVRMRPGRVAGSVENQVEKPSRWQVVSTTPGTLVQITERANCITSLFGASLNSTLSSSNLPSITFTKQLSTMNCMGFRDLTNNNETWEILDFPHFFPTFRYNTKQDQQQTQSSAPFNQLLSNWIRCSCPPLSSSGPSIQLPDFANAAYLGSGQIERFTISRLAKKCTDARVWP